MPDLRWNLPAKQQEERESQGEVAELPRQWLITDRTMHTGGRRSRRARGFNCRDNAEQ